MHSGAKVIGPFNLTNSILTNKATQVQGVEFTVVPIGKMYICLALRLGPRPQHTFAPLRERVKTPKPKTLRSERKEGKWN